MSDTVAEPARCGAVSAGWLRTRRCVRADARVTRASRRRGEEAGRKRRVTGSGKNRQAGAPKHRQKIVGPPGRMVSTAGQQQWYGGVIRL